MSFLSDIVDTVTGKGARDAARGAADAQVQAAQLGIDETGRQFDETQALLQPFVGAGQESLDQVMALLGIGGDQEAAFDAFKESPGQKFIRDRAQRNLLRNQSAIGGLGGGNVRTALNEQGAGFAQQDFQNQITRLLGLVTGGQNAAARTGSAGAQSSSQIAQLLGNQGTAQAGGILGAQEGRASGVKNLLGLGTAFATGGFSPFTTASTSSVLV